MIDMQDYGYCADEANIYDNMIPARITEIHRELYKAICERGEVMANIKGSFFHNADCSHKTEPGCAVLKALNDWQPVAKTMEWVSCPKM